MSPRKVPFSSGESQSSYRIDNVSPRSHRDTDDDISVSRYRSPRMQRGNEPNRTYSTNSTTSDRARSLSPRASRYSSSESVSNLRNKFEKQPLPNPQNQGSFISPRKLPLFGMYICLVMYDVCAFISETIPH